MGSARQLQEARERAEAIAQGAELDAKRLRLEYRRSAQEAQVAALRAQLEAETLELSNEIAAGERRERQLEQDREAIAAARRGAGVSEDGQGTVTSMTDTGATETAAGEKFLLRLYVAGQTPKSLTAFANLRKICETHLAGRYEIEVIDLLERPQLARGDEIIAVPTLVRKLPEPITKLIGDLSDTERVLVGLQLMPEGW